MDVNINYLAVLVAAAASFILGWIWYGPVFGKIWMGLSGISPGKPSTTKMITVSALGFVGALLMSYVLAHALIFASAYTKSEGVGAGLMVGFWNWLGFIAPVTSGAVLWEGKSWKLWVLNNAYWLISLLGMGVILAVWR